MKKMRRGISKLVSVVTYGRGRSAAEVDGAAGVVEDDDSRGESSSIVGCWRA